MRPRNIIFPALAFLAALVSPPSLVRAQDAGESPSGTVPRSSAEKYCVHTEHKGVSVGAELLSTKEVAKEFAANLNQCCIVVHLAIYPQKDEPLDVSIHDFTLTEEGSAAPVRPQSAVVVEAKLIKDSGSNHGVTTTAGAGVGYESGTYVDPVTGQPVHVRGVTTSTEVGVGIGGGTPDVSDHDCEVVARELSEKGLPEAKVTVPVSGYLYFSIPKHKKDAKYTLEYVVKGESLSLQLP